MNIYEIVERGKLQQKPRMISKWQQLVFRKRKRKKTATETCDDIKMTTTAVIFENENWKLQQKPQMTPKWQQRSRFSKKKLEKFWKTFHLHTFFQKRFFVSSSSFSPHLLTSSSKSRFPGFCPFVLRKRVSKRNWEKKQISRTPMICLTRTCTCTKLQSYAWLVMSFSWPFIVNENLKTKKLQDVPLTHDLTNVLRKKLLTNIQGLFKKYLQRYRRLIMWFSWPFIVNENLRTFVDQETARCSSDTWLN